MFRNSAFFFKHRFHFLFTALLLLYMLHPLSDREMVGMWLLDVSFSLVLLTSLLAVSTRRRITVTAFALGVSAQILTSSSYFLQNKLFMLLGITADSIFLIYTTYIILIHILENKLVTADTIFGALCVYLLIGFIWAMICSFIEFAQHGSFQFNTGISRNVNDGSHIFSELYYLMYYSFTTLTTLGYGDVVPASPWARVFSALEAIVGQLYLVVLVSRLVGLHISQVKTKD